LRRIERCDRGSDGCGAGYDEIVRGTRHATSRVFVFLQFEENRIVVMGPAKIDLMIKGIVNEKYRPVD
jgi:hypothetical protein